jgi:glycosyltransferase involved in cell wall biosynthesis
MGATTIQKNGVIFSIIIPARNEERNIGRCLQSIAAVDWQSDAVEIILVDNGSTDSTLEIAQEYGARVFVLPGDTVAGLRNFGSAQSNGKILVFLDADCTVTPDWFSQAARYIDQSDVVCFGSPPVVPDDSTWVQRTWFYVRMKKGAFETDWLESMNMFVRREAFEQVSGFNAELVTCEDYDLSLRLQKLGRLISDDRIVAVHHGEAANLGHFFRKEHWRALGNLRGMGSHTFNWRELPSVLLPLIYCFLAFTMVVGLILVPFVSSNLLPYGLTGLLLIWQLPMWLLSLWKVRPSGGVIAASQLYVLMNIYFFARGLASLKWRS